MIWLSVAILILVVMLGVPIWLSVMLGSVIAVYFALGINPEVIPSVMFDKFTVYELVAVPLFMLVGQLINSGGAAKPLVNTLNSFMGHLPGGPAYVVIAACVVMAAMSSSSFAAIAGFGPIMVPMMVEMGYSKRFSIGLLTTASILGPLIPPSVPLIIYGVITGQSVKDLYTAAFIPGFMLAALLAVTVFIHARGAHFARRAPASWAERWQAVKKGWPVLLTPVVVLVPIYAGWCTATEASAVGVFYTLFIGFFVYRGLKLKGLYDSLANCVQVMGIIFLIIGAAFLLNFALTYERIPFRLGEILVGWGLSKYWFMLVVLIVYIIMGMFLDSTAILLVAVPILYPTVVGLGISPIVFGVFTVSCIEFGLITPPYGVTLFAASGILKERYEVVTRGTFLFYPAIIIGLVLIAYIPKISLVLLG